ncbi:MAG TPA: sialidase family protein [Vicinamibacterales bacterium]|nr:sialidase family protein [Vicinamibacterales bacterium]
MSGLRAHVQAPPSVVHVGPNVQVSVAKTSTMHGEGAITADPTDARRLLVCSMYFDEKIDHGIVVYASRDSGAHWDRTFETRVDQESGDPACAFGPDGVAYLTMIPDTSTAAQVRVTIFRSEDGGQIWRPAGMIGYIDRESIVVDGTGGRFHNRVYVHGTGFSGATDGASLSSVKLYASTDGGRTFGRPVERLSLNRRLAGPMGNSVVLSNGRWVAVFAERKQFGESNDDRPAAPLFSLPPEPEDTWVRVVSSDDGGDSLNELVTVSGWHMPNHYIRQSSTVPTIAADATNGPFADRLYVVWPDSRFGGTDVLLSYSADRGRTWAPPIIINDDRAPAPPAALPNHLLPAVAVNSAGVVAVTWLDRRDARDNLGWRERVRVSLDGGETFMASSVVGEAPSQFDGREHWPTFAYTSGGGSKVTSGGLIRMNILAPPHLYFPGDYAWVAAGVDGVFHPYWIDNRTGWPQVWTAAVQVAGSAIKNGAADLADLDDLTPLTELKWTSSEYDRSTHTVSATLRLDNTSTRTLQGPFKIRLIRSDSDVASLEAIGASNGLTGPGAVWDVTAFTTESRLAPGSTSRPFILSSKLHDVRPLLERHGQGGFKLLASFSRVLGHIGK